jgi:DNA-binding response OmpR family regulator
MKALIVDDDRVLADVLAFTLRREGFQVIQAQDGEAALKRWAEEQPDLIVLDVNMPRLNGFEVCHRIREQERGAGQGASGLGASGLAFTPIILLTVRGEEDDIVHGLELGADDYITKPFSPRQLVARVQAVLRRTGRQGTGVAATADSVGIRRVGRLALDLYRREVRVNAGEPVPLTPLESRLLDYFMLNAGHVLTIEAIIGHVWGPEGADRDMLRQLVHRLRVKLALLSAKPIEPSTAPYTPEIETVPGLGYGLLVPPESSIE